jgi:hypothetical protein
MTLRSAMLAEIRRLPEPFDTYLIAWHSKHLALIQAGDTLPTLDTVA